MQTEPCLACATWPTTVALSGAAIDLRDAGNRSLSADVSCGFCKGHPGYATHDENKRFASLLAEHTARSVSAPIPQDAVDMLAVELYRRLISATGGDGQW